LRNRRMGNTSLSLSEIAFGCGGNAGLMTTGGRREQCRVVARAIELGINYFDNAPDYGDGLAEANLGHALREVGVRPYVGSKVEIRTEDLADIASHIRRSVDQSLSRLGLDYVDVLQIHNGPVPHIPILEGRSYWQLSIDDFFKPNGAIAGLEQVLDEGKARHLGFICRGNDLGAVRQLLDTGLFRLINVPYTLLNPTASPLPSVPQAKEDLGGVIEEAARRGVGVAVYSPLAGGMLTDECVDGLGLQSPTMQRLSPDVFQRFKANAGSLRRIGRLAGVNLPHFAYRFILDNPGVTTVLGGFSTIEQLNELAWVSEMAPLAPDIVRRLEELWRNDFDV
jgi:aryl-alcohol dehydrogenase-like predicted oxidoreductase